MWCTSQHIMVSKFSCIVLLYVSSVLFDNCLRILQQPDVRFLSEIYRTFYIKVECTLFRLVPNIGPGSTMFKIKPIDFRSWLQAHVERMVTSSMYHYFARVGPASKPGTAVSSRDVRVRPHTVLRVSRSTSKHALLCWAVVACLSTLLWPCASIFLLYLVHV